MRRLGALCLSLLLLAAACSGSNDQDDATSTSSTFALSTSAPDTTAASTTPATATTLPPSATAPPPDDWPDHPLLVVNTDGVYQLHSDAGITQLVQGAVAYAVDDTRGGLLFQLERGRWSDAYGEQPSTPRSTVVWWIPAGASAPQELLVPTPGEGHYLSLHDAYPTADSFAVVYERHEGTIPYGTDADMADRLRVYDVATGTVSDVYRTRGHEWWLSDVSAGDGLIAATEDQILGNGCRLFDTVTGVAVTRPGFPSATPKCFDETTECATSCALASDAGRVVYDRLRRIDDGADWMIAVADVDAGSEVTRFSVPVSGRWGPAELDIAGESVLLNRHWEGTYDQPALLVDLRDPERAPIAVPVVGRARFVTQPVDIAGPVTAPAYTVSGPDYYRYGDDGLFRVVDGVETRLLEDSVGHVWDDHMGGVIITDVTASEILHLRAGDTTPTPLIRESGYAYARFTGVVNGHPSLFFAGIPEGADLDEWACDEWSLNSHDLITGDEQPHLCLPIEDADLGIRSIGGERFVGAHSGMCGGTSTSTAIRFWDLDGNPANLPANPFPPTESCAPCELEALISPDGSLLAYRHRPDSFTDQSPNYSGPACGGGAEQVDAWWQQSKNIPAQIAVVDLDTGGTIWTIEGAADTHLSDFDGRYVVVSRAGQTTIYDTSGELPPVEVGGSVALMHPVASGDEVFLWSEGLGPVRFGDPAGTAVDTLIALLGPAGNDEEIDPVQDGIALPAGWVADRYFRHVWWPDRGLTAVFSDAAYFRDDATPHFIAWRIRQSGLKTSSGITVGSNVAELRDAYGDAVSTWSSDACETGWRFRVGPLVWGGSLDATQPLNGLLDGDPSDPETRIAELGAGAGASC